MFGYDAKQGRNRARGVETEAESAEEKRANHVGLVGWQTRLTLLRDRIVPVKLHGDKRATGNQPLLAPSDLSPTAI